MAVNTALWVGGIKIRCLADNLSALAELQLALAASQPLYKMLSASYTGDRGFVPTWRRINPPAKLNMPETEIIFNWPTDEGIWMGNIPEIGWLPLQTMALTDDLPSVEQMRLEAEHEAPPRRILAIVAQWLESATSWPYTFKGCHPVKEWRRPTKEELFKARIFYGKISPDGKPK